MSPPVLNLVFTITSTSNASSNFQPLPSSLLNLILLSYLRYYGVCPGICRYFKEVAIWWYFKVSKSIFKVSAGISRHWEVFAKVLGGICRYFKVLGKYQYLGITTTDLHKLDSTWKHERSCCSSKDYQRSIIGHQRL